MAEKRQRINVNIYRASHNAEESQYIFDVEEELKKLPKSPGVYIMHSKNDDILYVGKAVSLHSRVRQYFQTGHGHGVIFFLQMCKDCQNGVADRVF